VGEERNKLSHVEKQSFGLYDSITNFSIYRISITFYFD